MAYQLIEGHGTAGNGSDATIYTAPSAGKVVISNVTAYNSTGGALTTTLTLTETDGTTSTVAKATVNATSSKSFSGASADCVTPIVLLGGSKLNASAGGAGVSIRISGVLFT